MATLDLSIRRPNLLTVPSAATRGDNRQGDQSRRVVADPKGNEVRVLAHLA
jgi:hypothetical protein